MNVLNRVQQGDFSSRIQDQGCDEFAVIADVYKRQGDRRRMSFCTDSAIGTADQKHASGYGGFPEG